MMTDRVVSVVDDGSEGLVLDRDGISVTRERRRNQNSYPPHVNEGRHPKGRVAAGRSICTATTKPSHIRERFHGLPLMYTCVNAITLLYFRCHSCLSRTGDTAMRFATTIVIVAPDSPAPRSLMSGERTNHVHLMFMGREPGMIPGSYRESVIQEVSVIGVETMTDALNQLNREVVERAVAHGIPMEPGCFGWDIDPIAVEAFVHIIEA